MRTLPRHSTLVASSILAVGAVVLALSGCSSAGDASDPTPTTSATATATPWSYHGASGPAHWGDANPACASSAEAQQSPIDIRTGSLQTSTHTAIATQYGPTTFTLENTGHTIEAVPAATAKQTITLEGTEYTLTQFHFHAHSEHTIDGDPAAAELHLVHASSTGALAVIGVPIEVGAENVPLAELFSSIHAVPHADNEAGLATMIDVGRLLPTSKEVARYQGSLTTPPCSEGVTWSVFLSPVTVSQAQLDALTAVYRDNARPTQPLNGRAIEAGSVG